MVIPMIGIVIQCQGWLMPPSVLFGRTSHPQVSLASDTWGCEVRPNNTEGGINQPWHWITIPIMGMTMGEIFYLKDLADDCAADKVYEFMFVAPAIPITGAVGSPTNPLAIK